MADKRKKLSGFAYRKLAKEKAKRQSSELEHTRKMETFFEKAKREDLDVIPEEAESSESPCSSSHLRTTDITEGTSHDEDISTELADNSSLMTTDEVTEKQPCEEISSPLTSLRLSENKSLEDELHFSSDPVDWDKQDEKLKDFLAFNGVSQNKEADFSSSVRHYPDKSRCMSDTLFKSERPNGEYIPRPWLVYSIKTCYLYSGIGKLAHEGYNDWKNASVRLNEHEESKFHKDCYLRMQNRAKISGRIDQLFLEKQNQEMEYWRNVLKRVVTAVKTLSSRGLPFRGTDEKFGSLTNGNYLMLLEAIAEHDPFLAEHIKKYGNTGSGSTSYLSKTVCFEFIDIVASSVLEVILNEAKQAKYYSISVDSTPDVSHTDHLAFIIRYVKNDGIPKERFIKFIPNVGHKAENLFSAVMDTLKEYHIDIMDCRGQSYDNASNMSGPYSGLQARIKQVNPLAVYTPCSAHSLNLVGTSAAESCREAVSFFYILQQLYNFFSASSTRWEMLISHLKRKATVVKNLSTTRWSARSDACLSLSRSWKEIIEALDAIDDDVSQTPATQNEASGLSKNLQKLETAIMTVFWSFILERFNATNKRLQCVDIEIGTVVRLYDGLTTLVQDTRDDFERFEREARELSGLEDYDASTARPRKIKLPFDVSPQGHIQLSPRDKFRVNTFLPILDKLSHELRRRAEAYKSLNSHFSLFENMSTLSNEDLLAQAHHLCSQYPNDMDDKLPNECLHLCSHLKSIGALDITIPQLLKTIVEDSLEVIYPNVYVALRIFLCTLATNCSAERSFSCLKRVKNYLRSSLNEERLNSFALLAIEADIVRKFSFDSIIDKFAKRKVRAKRLC
uniref:TTF-type domain-containing protein n=1 Tax=Xenopus tropicalis TaxID=8364 RepID=A0A1B8Y1W6_XENTR